MSMGPGGLWEGKGCINATHDTGGDGTPVTHAVGGDAGGSLFLMQQDRKMIVFAFLIISLLTGLH